MFRRKPPRLFTVSIALPFRPEAAPDLGMGLFLAVFEKCPEGIAIVQHARIVRSNPAFARLFGYPSPDDLEGQPLANLLPMHHRCAETQEPPDRSGKCGYPGCQFEGRHQDGSRSRMESSCAAFESGGEPFLLLTARDISSGERRRVFRDSEQRYRAIFDAAAIGIVQCMMDGRVVETNPAAERMLGYTREELRGMHFRDFTHPDDVQTDLDLFEQIVAGNRDHYQIEIRSLRKDKTYGWLRLTVSLVRGPAGEAESVIGVAEDITERKAAEKQLREAQKMEAVGRLVGGVAHDFNNLLTAVTLYADLVRAGLDPGSRLQRHVDEIRVASEQGAALIQHLLAMVRQQPIEPRIVDVNDVIASMGNMLARLIGENIEVRTQLADDLPSVRIDPVQLQQVILNLALNARDAMSGGGSVEIATRNCQKVCNLQRLGEPAPAACCVALSVADNGCGMDAETRSHLFEPFFTTKMPGQGNGLGLATVQVITKDAGGTIQVNSEVGKGTRVTVLLPCADEAVGERATSSMLPVRGGKETILLVEDDPQVRRSVQRVLRRYGYRVLVCGNGAEALKLVQTNRAIHLLITDLVLPGMDGREVARELCRFRPELRVLLTSGFDHTPMSPDSAAGRVVLFRKPFTGDLLARKVREVLDADWGAIPKEKG